MSSKDLGYTSWVVERSKFEYSPLGEVFNKGLDEDHKKEVLLKRVQNVKNKSEKQLESVELTNRNN